MYSFLTRVRALDHGMSPEGREVRAESVSQVGVNTRADELEVIWYAVFEWNDDVLGLPGSLPLAHHEVELEVLSDAVTIKHALFVTSEYVKSTSNHFIRNCIGNLDVEVAAHFVQTELSRCGFVKRVQSPNSLKPIILKVIHPHTQLSNV